MKNLENLLKPYISEDHLVQMTSDMVSIESYNGIENQETGVAKYIKSVFDANGIPCELMEVEDGRCNVVARLEGKAPGRSIMFNGHTDTVEPNDMEDAFTPKIVDGKLYGRGTSDMKGPLASMMEAMIAIKKADILDKGSIIFTGVLDEEHNSIGTIDLLNKGILADAAIIGEPSELQICTAHRGLEWLKFHFIGKTVHGGKQKEGINAISKAVDFINELEENLIPKVNEKKHPLLDQATINVGVIHGGTQLSTVAGDCELYVDRRFLPYEPHEEVMKEFEDVLAKLSAKDPQFKCEMKVTDESQMKDGYVHMPMEISLDHELVGMMQKSVQEVTGEEPVMTYFPAWTDAGLLNGYAKIPCIVLGPGMVECCHSAEEHIPVDHLPKAAMIYALTALQFLSAEK